MNNLFFQNYENFKEKSLSHRRFKHADVSALLAKIALQKFVELEEIGKSLEGRTISALRLGKGKTHVLLWSQMHGNEPTATAAIFDILNFFASEEGAALCAAISEKLTVHFIPMLNPDGAELFTRRNAAGIDLNRDAEAQQMPETQALFAYMQKVKPQVAFNLHDQATKYAVGNTKKEATISLLAPEEDTAASISKNRLLAMQIIAVLNQRAQHFAAGHVARYDDSFTPRCVGDQFQKAGIATILIESGASRGDLERQFTRKLNGAILLAAFQSLSSGGFAEFTKDDYFAIPVNKERIFDLLIRNTSVLFFGRTAQVDIGFRNKELTNGYTFTIHAEVEDFGDLRAYYGLSEFNAEGAKLRITAGKLSLDSPCDFELLKNGRVQARVENGKLWVDK
jgi:predicted deacylase